MITGAAAESAKVAGISKQRTALQRDNIDSDGASTKTKRSSIKDVHTEGKGRVQNVKIGRKKSGHGEGLFKLQRTSTSCTIILCDIFTVA